MILVLAGTKEGRTIAESLSSMGFSVIASTVTKYGERLFDKGVHVQTGPLDTQAMKEFIEENGIKVVIDATHPFAKDASLNAIEACRSTKIKYIRYEREGIHRIYSSKIIHTKDFDEAAQKLEKFNRIFLAIGSKNLDKFIKLKARGKKIIARVLPESGVLKRCEELGLLPKEIIAVQGPFSVEMNYYMFRDFRADVVVTKDSGAQGGVFEKLEAAERLDIPVVLIERPRVDYPVVVKDITALLKEMDFKNGA
ncbi:precorrin-6A reductase [Thermoanaerobacterium sp. DL9XJH110]|uniref:precorrin-6A reductase n=1 Tax=Thermoanaerobacterium sp. DL9XJH110 TaxID=3386643 RepID=UPI003BB7D9AB